METNIPRVLLLCSLILFITQNPFCLAPPTSNNYSFPDIGQIQGQRIQTEDGCFIRIGNTYYSLEDTSDVISQRNIIPYPRLWLGNAELVNRLSAENIKKFLGDIANPPSMSKTNIPAELSANIYQDPGPGASVQAIDYLTDFMNTTKPLYEAELMLVVHYISILLRSSDFNSNHTGKDAFSFVCDLVRKNNNLIAMKALYLLQLLIEDEQLVLATKRREAAKRNYNTAVTYFDDKLKRYEHIIRRIDALNKNKQGYRKYAIKPDGKGNWHVVRLSFPGRWIMKGRNLNSTPRLFKLRTLKSFAIALEKISGDEKNNAFNNTAVIIDDNPDSLADILEEGSYIVKKDINKNICIAISKDADSPENTYAHIIIKHSFLQKSSGEQQEIFMSTMALESKELFIPKRLHKEDISRKHEEKKVSTLCIPLILSQRYGQQLLVEELVQRGLQAARLQHISGDIERTEKTYNVKRALEDDNKMRQILAEVEKADLIVLSIYDDLVDETYTLIKKIKSKFPKKLIAIGGPNVIKAPEEMAIIFEEADIVFRGFDPARFADLVENISIDRTDGKPSLNESLILSNDKEGGLLIDLGNKFIIDNLESVNRGTLRLPDYRQKTYIEYLCVSRGCTKGCKFCENFPTTGHHAIKPSEILEWAKKRRAFLIELRDSTLSQQLQDHLNQTCSEVKDKDAARDALQRKIQEILPDRTIDFPEKLRILSTLQIEDTELKKIINDSVSLYQDRYSCAVFLDLRRRNALYIQLDDDDLLWNSRWGDEFIRLFTAEAKKYDTPPFEIWIGQGSTADFLDKDRRPHVELINRLKTAGVPESQMNTPDLSVKPSIGLGIDGMSDQACLELHKNHSFEEAFNLMEALLDVNILVSFNYIASNPHMSRRDFLKGLLNYVILVEKGYEPRVISKNILAFFGSNFTNRYIVDNASHLHWKTQEKTDIPSDNNTIFLHLGDDDYVYLAPFDIDPSPAIATILDMCQYEDFKPAGFGLLRLPPKIIDVIKEHFLDELPGLINTDDIFFREKKDLYRRLTEIKADELVEAGKIFQAVLLYDTYLNFDPDEIDIISRFNYLIEHSKAGLTQSAQSSALEVNAHDSLQQKSH